MKITRTLIALLLVLTLVLSLFACGKCEDHVDEDGNGLCDTEGCGAPVAGAKLNATATATYTAAVENALKTAKTATVKVEYDITTSSTAPVDAEGNAIEGLTAETETVEADATITLSETEDGVNAEIKLTSTTVGGGETETEDIDILIVDGVMYRKDAENPEWVSQPLPTAEDILAMIPESIITTISSLIPEDFEITEDDIAAFKTAINDALSQVLTMNEDGSVGVTVDVAPTVRQLIAAIIAIDEDDTVASLIDPYLTAAGFTGGIEALLDSYALLGSVTVGALYTSINGAVEAQLDMGIADIYSTIMANTDIQALLVSNGLVSVKDLPTMVALDIDALVDGYKTVTVDQLLTMMAQQMAGSEEAALSVEQLIAMAKTYATTPIATLIPVLTEIQESLAEVKIDAFEECYYVSLDENGALNALTTAFTEKITVPVTVYEDGVLVAKSQLTTDVSARVTVTGFGTEAPTITAPDLTPGTGADV